MPTNRPSEDSTTNPAGFAGASQAIYPQFFSSGAVSSGADAYLSEPLARHLAKFFDAKGLAAIKDEDRLETWHADWIAYQAERRMYATLLTPKQFSASGSQLDLLRLTRFLEVFAYFSPAHGYSLQVSFLGFFSVLMGDNAALKSEAVAMLQAGGLLAFGVSEKDHGSDLFGNEFTVQMTPSGDFVANGSKYYIGNANVAAMVSVLARKIEPGAGHNKRPPFVLVAVRPDKATGYGNLRKIRTLGIRSAYVGGFDVSDQALPASDVIAEGRQAWDAVFGTVTLGKFFLGFGSIGICEHALEEAAGHVCRRVLYGKPVIAMPHIRMAMAQAYARLTAMKLYAYRALDYVAAATAADRRYLLFNAVQKAKVSTEGVKVMALLSECIGAKGFESNTYFEMALRDIQLIPGLEGSAHINLGLTARFLSRYFTRPAANLADPPSLFGGEAPAHENPYLMEARAGAINTIAFQRYLRAYVPLKSIRNIRLFAHQAAAFARFIKTIRMEGDGPADLQASLLYGQCLATIAYGQLIAENAVRLGMARQIISTIFHLLIGDLNGFMLTLAADSAVPPERKKILQRIVEISETTAADWEWVAGRIESVA